HAGNVWLRKLVAVTHWRRTMKRPSFVQGAPMFRRRIPLIVASSLLLGLPLGARRQWASRPADESQTPARWEAPASSPVSGPPNGRRNRSDRKELNAAGAELAPGRRK